MIQLFKYGLISAGGYLSILALMYVGVDLLRIPKTVAFVIVYALAYVAEYCLNLKYLFKVDHSWMTVLKFGCHIGCFISLGSLVFRGIVGWGVHYLFAVVLTAMALFPLRFLAYKFIVFRERACSWDQSRK